MALTRLLSACGLQATKTKRDDQISERARRVLVQTLYTQPASLALGAVAGILASAVSAWIAGVAIFWTAFSVLSIIAIGRVALAYGLAPSLEKFSTNRLETLYEIGAFTYALALGSVAAMTLLFDAAVEAQLMMVANALC